VAAQVLGIPYAEAVARYKAKDHAAVEARQVGKVANFGFPGGLGAARFVYFAHKSYGVDVTEHRAAGLKGQWLKAWPEMHEYFARIRGLETPRGYRLRHLYTEVTRAGMTYTAACNSPFQHLGAACAKRGLVEVQRRAYNDPGSVIYGARTCNMVHDQILVEVPHLAWGAKRTHEAAHEVARLFALGAQKYLKHVQIDVEPLLSLCWSKRAEPTHDQEGNLVPWRPSDEE
jgi:DNA polymerase-1